MFEIIASRMVEVRANQPLSRSLVQGVLNGAIGFAVSAAGWWLLLGWDHSGTYDEHGNYSGPYEAWQVIGLVIAMGLFAVWLGVRGSFFAGPFGGAVALTASFAVGAHADSSGLWVVGASTLAVASFAGLALVALVVHSFVKVRRHRVHRALLSR